MIEEPKPMREIHKIREKMYEEFRGLSIHEMVLIVNKNAEEEKKRIFGAVSEENEEYATRDD